MRSCRINVGVITMIAMIVAIAVSATALATASWQIADFTAYPTIRRIYYRGLVENCVRYLEPTVNQFGASPVGGPLVVYDPNSNFPQNLAILGPPWLGPGGMLPFQNLAIESERCARIPYDSFFGTPTQDFSLTFSQFQHAQQIQNMPWFIMTPSNYPQLFRQQIGENWRLATLALLSVTCGLGFFALLAELADACLDYFQVEICIASAASFVFMLISFLSGVAAIVLFASNTGQYEEIYILEMNAIAKFQWGRAFWLGVGGVGAAGVALLFDLMHVLLVCVATRNQQKTPRLQRGVPARKSINEMYDQLPNVIRLDKHGMILDKARLK